MLLPRFVLLYLLFFLFTACGGGNEGAEAISDDPYEAAAQQLQDLQEKRLDRPVLEADDVKAMAPDDLLGLKRTNRKANKVGAGGFEMATLNATYKNDDSRRRITLTIMDGMGGNLPGMGLINSFTIDEEEGTRTTKSLKIDGYKAVRSYDTATKNGELTILYPQSMVKIEGRHLEGIDDLEDAYAALHLGKLK